MPVNLSAPLAENIYPIKGIVLGTAYAGIRKVERRDVCVMVLSEKARVAGVFTQNRFCAAPVLICREHLAYCQEKTLAIRALVMNAGCANAGTGQQGLSDAKQSCAHIAEMLHVKTEQVLVFSTGVIFEYLPIAKLLIGIQTAYQNLHTAHWIEAAQAIMTTDTVAKVFSKQISVDGHPVRITGIAKGAGMIHPNMATMLGFIAIDAAMSQAVIDEIITRVCDLSFNAISIDGDTSTNDAFILIASGESSLPPVTDRLSSIAQLLEALVLEAAQWLAKAIVRDGEGATKLITIKIEQARTIPEAKQVAFAIAHSPLVKTAFFASDPNLGRLLAAIGKAGVNDLESAKVSLYLDAYPVLIEGMKHHQYQEAEAQRIMLQDEITVRVLLGKRGEAHCEVWTCDLSHDYITINADYRS